MQIAQVIHVRKEDPFLTVFHNGNYSIIYSNQLKNSKKYITIECPENLFIFIQLCYFIHLFILFIYFIHI